MINDDNNKNMQYVIRNLTPDFKINNSKHKYDLLVCCFFFRIHFLSFVSYYFEVVSNLKLDP